jgi:hypothetical protein
MNRSKQDRGEQTCKISLLSRRPVLQLPASCPARAANFHFFHFFEIFPIFVDENLIVVCKVGDVVRA